MKMSLLFVLLLSLSSAFPHGTAHSAGTTQDLVSESCSQARYRSLCTKSLSSVAPSLKTPSDVAKASLSVALDRTKDTSTYVSELAKGGKFADDMEKKVLNDCVKGLSSCKDQLKRTISELESVKPDTFQWQMSNAQTWVSAALTNVNTCRNGYATIQGETKAPIRRKIRQVSRLTSNALYLINRAVAVQA